MESDMRVQAGLGGGTVEHLRDNLVKGYAEG